VKDLSQRCIFSGNTENLNTIMEITLDGEKYKVAVSEEFEDEASPAAIRKRIPERIAELEKAKSDMMAKLEEFKALASELGFDLVKKTQSGLILAEEKTEQPRESAPADPNALANAPTTKVGDATFKVQKNERSKKSSEEGMTPEEVEAAQEAAKRKSAAFQGAPRATSGEAARYSQHLLPESAAIKTPTGVKEVQRPEIFAKQMQTVKGREGVPVAIPRTLSGSDGKTTISIVDTGGDRTIQARAKQLGAMREMGDSTDYSQTCRPCQGTGFHAKKPCKTCDGTGFLI
jgi:hypothetical protein